MNGTTLEFSPPLDTAQYADNDVMFECVELKDAVLRPGGRALLVDVLVIDSSDQGAAFDLVFTDAPVALGAAVNAALAISDENAQHIIRRVPVLASDYYDTGGNRVADFAVVKKLKAGTSQSLWVFGVSRGTGTYAATALKIKLNLDWE